MQLSSERDRIIMFMMHGPLDRSASPHVDLALQDANPWAFPFCSQWPCRIWDVLHEFWHLDLHEFWSFFTSNLYFGQILEFGCGQDFAWFSIVRWLGHVIFIMSCRTIFNSVLFSLNSIFQFSQSAVAYRLSWHMNEYLFVRVAQDFLFGCKISYLAFFQNFNQRQRQKEALSCRPWDLMHNRLNNLWDLIVDMDLLLVTSIFSYLITTCE